MLTATTIDIPGLVARLAEFDAAQQLASDLGRNVDLIDLSRASAVFRAQVLGTGTAVHFADHQKREPYTGHT
jgi:hypothetical protein